MLELHLDRRLVLLFLSDKRRVVIAISFDVLDENYFAAFVLPFLSCLCLGRLSLWQVHELGRLAFLLGRLLQFLLGRLISVSRGIFFDHFLAELNSQRTLQ